MDETRTFRPPPLVPGAPYVTCACPGMRVHRGPPPARQCTGCGRLVCAAHVGTDLRSSRYCVCVTCVKED